VAKPNSNPLPSTEPTYQKHKRKHQKKQQKKQHTVRECENWRKLTTVSTQIRKKHKHKYGKLQASGNSLSDTKNVQQGALSTSRHS
jgi:hypothetical protein